jgi:hypothetical protein
VQECGYLEENGRLAIRYSLWMIFRNFNAMEFSGGTAEFCPVASPNFSIIGQSIIIERVP